jgi:hypothetical protein
MLSSENLCIGGFLDLDQRPTVLTFRSQPVSLKRIHSIPIPADYSNSGSDGIFGRDRLANGLFMKISQTEVVGDEVGHRRREPAGLIESCAAGSAS